VILVVYVAVDFAGVETGNREGCSLS